MAISKSNPSPFQISSRNVASSMRTKRNCWFMYTFEFPEASIELRSSVLRSPILPLNQSWQHTPFRVSPSHFPWLVWISSGNLAPLNLRMWPSPMTRALSQPTTSCTSPFQVAYLPRILEMYLYQFSELAEKYCRNCETFARHRQDCPFGGVGFERDFSTTVLRQFFIHTKYSIHTRNHFLYET